VYSDLPQGMKSSLLNFNDKFFITNNAYFILMKSFLVCMIFNELSTLIGA